MNTPAVSIIIPVCNQLGYTRLCLDYLMRNTKFDFELVIVDNGSRDRTPKFLVEMSRQFDIAYIRNHENLGPIVALNQGINAAMGDIVLAMHNDLIIFESGWLAKVVQVISDNPGIGLVGLAGRTAIDRRGVVDEASLVHSLINEDLNEPMKELWKEVAVLDGVFIGGRKKVFNELDGFEQAYGMMHYYDLDISLKAGSAGYMNAVVNVEAMHVNNGGMTRKTQAYKRLVPDDLKLLNENSRIFHRKWAKYLPIKKG